MIRFGPKYHTSTNHTYFPDIKIKVISTKLFKLYHSTFKNEKLHLTFLRIFYKLFPVPFFHYYENHNFFYIGVI